MNTQRINILVGIFVLLGLMAMAFLAISMGGGRFSLPKGHHFQLVARFTNADGLRSGSTVAIAGVPVGEVKKIALKPDDMSAMVTFEVDSDLVLDDDTVAAIHSAGLLGEKFVALKPGASGTPLKPGAVIVDTQSTVDLEDLMAKFAFGSTEKK
jgi:phospholipid/cholesterol/gamma-HCH transport system substrate-binding protein